jgi:hypothetical protein
VKRVGDKILDHVRFVIATAAGDDPDMRFSLNRWIFQRLSNEERLAKKSIKAKLWRTGMQSCQACGEGFKSPKNVEIHRKDDMRGYFVENCELLCRDCHIELGRRE